MDLILTYGIYFVLVMAFVAALALVGWGLSSLKKYFQITR